MFAGTGKRRGFFTFAPVLAVLYVLLTASAGSAQEQAAASAAPISAATAATAAAPDAPTAADEEESLAGAPAPEPVAGGSRPAAAVQRRITHQVAPGIQHVQILRESRSRPLAANLLRADPRQSGWHLQVWPARDILLTPDVTKGREAVGKLAARRGALAAINAGYFGGNGDPLGLQVTDGQILSEPYPGRSAFGLTRDGRALWGPVRFVATARVGDRTFPIKGVNRPRAGNELIVYTPRYAASTGTNGSGTEAVVEWLNGPLRAGIAAEGTLSETRPRMGDAQIPAEGLVLSGHGAAAEFLQAANTGDAARIEIHLVGEDGANWDEAWQAVGAGPRLLRNGAVCLKPGAEGFRRDVLNGRAPRSAVGMARDGTLLIAAVDGRQMASGGMTLTELAEWLKSEGAVDAINLDGGGSTTLSLRQVVVNLPSQGTQRLVANALLIVLDQEPPVEAGELALLAPEGVTVVEGSVPVPAGSRVRFRAARRLADGSWQDLPEDAVTWSLDGHVGSLAQDGTFLGMRSGPGAVTFSTGKQMARAQIRTVAGPPAVVTAAFEAAPAPDQPATVRVRVVDAYDNAVAGAEVKLAYATAEGAQVATAVTDGRGGARLPLPAAQVAAGTPVTVASGSAPAAAVRLPKIAAALAPAPAAEDAAGSRN